MKKTLITGLSLLIMLALCSCGNKNTNTNSEQTELQHPAINQAEEAVEGYENRLENITGEVEGWEDTNVIDEVIPVDDPIPDESEIINY